MTYASMMVHLEIGRPNAALLEVAGNLAARFHSNLTGVAASQLAQLIYGSEYLPNDILQEQHEAVRKGLQSLEAEFRNALGKHAGNLQWRAAATYSSPTDYFAQQARIADLFIVGADRDAPRFGASREVDIGALILQIGRPVLIVPAGVHAPGFDHVMLAWRDAREARLAASLALPFLKVARKVHVVELVHDDDLTDAYANLKEVRSWLGMHGVMTEPIASVSKGNEAEELNAIAEKYQVDLLVAGAYGHSRLREAVLGGVTRDLLLHPQRCTLVAH
ncbi:MAG TPA: universal stress protein [Rhodocyclaceae bacterium]|nr:universal stress protein [Rhodocyclaceae bacterium]